MAIRRREGDRDNKRRKNTYTYTYTRTLCLFSSRAILSKGKFCRLKLLLKFAHLALVHAVDLHQLLILLVSNLYMCTFMYDKADRELV